MLSRYWTCLWQLFAVEHNLYPNKYPYFRVECCRTAILLLDPYLLINPICWPPLWTTRDQQKSVAVWNFLVCLIVAAKFFVFKIELYTLLKWQLHSCILDQFAKNIIINSPELIHVFMIREFVADKDFTRNMSLYKKMNISNYNLTWNR